jgi:hypothetical protein
MATVKQVLASQGIVRTDEKKNLPAMVTNGDDYRQRYINDIAKEFGKPL